MLLPRCLVGLLCSLPIVSAAQSVVPAASKLTPNLVSTIDRPLRYRPDGADFVIENGTEIFNRPLYGGNTAFRVDGGDRPEFVLYLPGRGGNLRLGVRSDQGARWLHDAERIVARYRPGQMIHEIRDPLLGTGGMIEVSAVAYAETEGLGVQVRARGIAPGVELIWAFGGVNGQRGRRGGDIGTEDVPISQWFQLQPEFCRGDVIEPAEHGFRLRGRPATIVGVVPEGAAVLIGDANAWSDPQRLLAAARKDGALPEFPVSVGHVALGEAPLYLSLQRAPAEATSANAVAAPDLDTYGAVTSGGAPREQPKEPSLAQPFAPTEVARRFAAAERHFEALRQRVVVDTPDAFLNTAVGALNVGADAVWDEPQQAIMHGAIAWRTKLLGWRGPYSLDALGWHDRARANARYWMGRQNTQLVSGGVPPADENANLARNESGLHTNGDMSNSHYDMNLVFVDALFRHLQWTGDLAFASEAWPVIERHLAWERRLFRREFGPEKLPLYEAYAAIWASDDLQYSGGGVTHASAYNYYHHRQAARLARLLGKDGTAYDREADAIARAMRELLWLPEGGFAEYKDWLGAQRVHPHAALWSFYHVTDSEVPRADEAWLLTRKVQTEIPRLPVRGPGVPDGLATVATSNWFPYDWSINNVVMSEAVHGALGFWQAGRPDEAWSIMKGSLLAAMYMGISPGNVGSMSYLDVYRRESQRDFADGSGVLSRALVEGLFGVKPDALARVMHVTPGWPAEWARAAIEHPDFSLRFERNGRTDTYVLRQALGHAAAEAAAGPPVVTGWRQPLALRLVAMARSDRVAEVLVNGRPAPWSVVEQAVGAPRIAIDAPAGSGGAASTEVTIRWAGEPIRRVDGRFTPVEQGQMRWRSAPATAWTPPGALRADPVIAAALQPSSPAGEYQPLDLTAVFNDSVTQIFRQEYRTPRSPFVSLALPKQGIGGWAGGVKKTALIDDAGLRSAAARDEGLIRLPDGVPIRTTAQPEGHNVAFASLWDNYPDEIVVSLDGAAKAAVLLVAGSTNAMQSQFENGQVIATYADGSTQVLPLHNPTTWWPIEQDYFIDDFQFRHPGPVPTRIDLKTGRIRVLELDTFKGQGRAVDGGAATVLRMKLDPQKQLRSLAIRATANDVVIGLMAVTLIR